MNIYIPFDTSIHAHTHQRLQKQQPTTHFQTAHQRCASRGWMQHQLGSTSYKSLGFHPSSTSHSFTRPGREAAVLGEVLGVLEKWRVLEVFLALFFFWGGICVFFLSHFCWIENCFLNSIFWMCVWIIGCFFFFGFR